jgi:hypothetical protein
MRIYCLIAILLLAANSHAAAQKDCTVEQSKRAFDEVDKLTNWQAVQRFYKNYLPCDDGGIAEGVSDDITKLLANHWSDFSTLTAMIAKEPAFEGFVVRHIDATVPDEALHKIRTNAQSRCPQRSMAICKKIVDAATSAIKESAE